MVMIALSSCNHNAVYDEPEAGCSQTYHIRFKYDYNMNFSDAFQSQVKFVSLYLINEDGSIMFHKQEPVSTTAGIYKMNVDVAPGNYSIIAWCTAGDNENYIIPASDSADNLGVSIKSTGNINGTEYAQSRLDGLWYGCLEDVEFPEKTAKNEICVPLIKDTNTFSVSVQSNNGTPLEKSSLDFEIHDRNLTLNSMNQLYPALPVVYLPWKTDAGLRTCVSASLSTSRLLVENREYAKLKVFDSESREELASINIIDAILKTKDIQYTNLSNQEYLDREDKFNIIFVFDNHMKWIETRIVVNDWNYIYKDVDMK